MLSYHFVSLLNDNNLDLRFRNPFNSFPGNIDYLRGGIGDDDYDFRFRPQNNFSRKIDKILNSVSSF